MIEQILTSPICLECQGCCRFAQPESAWSPSLLQEDIQELLQHRVPPSVMTPANKIRLVPDSGGESFLCAFFNPRNHQCKIYAFRPFECRLYPFLIHRKAKKVFLACDLRCPFIKENRKSQPLKKYIRYLRGFLNSPEFLSLLRANPHIAQRYDGVLDLAEIKI